MKKVELYYATRIFTRLTCICSSVGVAQNCSTNGHSLSGASFLRICFLFGRDSSKEFLNFDC